MLVMSVTQWASYPFYSYIDKFNKQSQIYVRLKSSLRLSIDILLHLKIKVVFTTKK